MTKLGANLTDAQRAVFREAIRDAHKHAARRAAEDRQAPLFVDVYA